MKITISGSKDEIKEVLQAIAGSSKHLELVHGSSRPIPQPIESQTSAKKSDPAIIIHDPITAQDLAAIRAWKARKRSERQS